ncbi:CheW-like domain-containing protein [Natronorubrum sediminis]|uniref:CheW-like domain-containing protein n=1 Tax=Natronorubrum sediminis TaxID=640943 RepID=A0A1H6FMV3_9EURY|nr:chemotaxis protein CheW [Natronorubrum sediminis]SEH12216.1 CheW-like domain-containing protein [Natronorubrum sediminis]
MTPDLSERLLGIDIDDASDGGRNGEGASPVDQEEREQFLFVGLGEHRFALPIDAVQTLADVPEDVTRVPRSPKPIEGLMDLRGEITAVVDPHVHFPDIEADERNGRERLLVLDRPTDQQSAAIRVDDVIGVESIGVSKVHDKSTVEDRPFSGDSLAHPLVDALIEQERSPSTQSIRASRPTGTDTANPLDLPADSSDTSLSTMQDRIDGDTRESDGESFELESTEHSNESAQSSVAADTETPREVVLEATPLLNVERLLLASGTQT